MFANPFKLPKMSRTRLVPDNRKQAAELGYAAVADALEVMPEPGVYRVPTDGPNAPPLVITARDSNTPEFHADLAARVVADFSRRAKVLEAEIHDLAISYERDRMEREAHYNETRAAKETELAGIRKTEAAYTGLASSLAPVDLGHGTFQPVAPRRKSSRPGRRETFTVPHGHEAVRDAEGRATGETHPIPPTHE